MKNWLMTVCSVMICVAVNISAKPKNIKIECGNSDSDAPALKKAPGNVKRLLKGNVLTVTLEIEGRSLNFVYKNSEDNKGELDGLKWQYCGYRKDMKLHLIKKEEDGYFSGKLLDENIGEDLEAGYRIIISEDGDTIFAARQPNGMDGEEWFLLDRYGKVLWKGESVFTDKQKSITAELESPDFDKDGNLTAVQKCTAEKAKKKTAKIILKKKDKKFQWESRISCPSA
ncbi:MAG TPA: hypothetical protein PL048_01045 [Leptospiraceae bacterium]|nr:hypothetical protein [Leptospiraceae bacterium]